jgi:hypothetical protein
MFHEDTVKNPDIALLMVPFSSITSFPSVVSSVKPVVVVASPSEVIW